MDGDVSKPARSTSDELEAFLRKVITESGRFGTVKAMAAVASYDIDTDKQTFQVIITLES